MRRRVKRRVRRIDWRSRPAKRMIGADLSISFRVRLADAAALSRLLRALPVPKEEIDRIGETIIGGVPSHYYTAVLGRARMHQLVADCPQVPSGVLFARAEFLFREAGVKEEE